MVLREFVPRNVSLLWDLHGNDSHIHTNNIPYIWRCPRFHEKCGPYLRLLHHHFPRCPLQLARWHRMFRTSSLFHASVDPEKAHTQSEAIQSDRYGPQTQWFQISLFNENDTNYALQCDELYDGRHFPQNA